MADIDTNNPKDSDLVSQFPANERSSRLAIQNILSADHEAGNDTADDGKHKIVRLLVQSTPGGTADEIKLYSKDKGGGELGLFIVDEAGNEAEIISDEVDATTDQKGVVELATQAETETGTDGDRAVTPAGFAGALNALLQDATTDQKGVVELATQGETETGTDGDRAVTPAGLSGSIPTILPDATTDQKGIVELATEQEVSDGTDDTRAVTPAALAGGNASAQEDGHVNLPGGITLQWGEKEVPVGSPTDILFSTAFGGSPWSVVWTDRFDDVNQGSGADIAETSRASDRFEVTIGGSGGAVTLNWVAIGPTA